MRLLTLFILLTASSSVFADSYTAVLSCNHMGRHTNIYACFKNTDLTIRKNGRTRLYKVYELNRAGSMRRDGLHISLPQRFGIAAQNSNRYLVLGLKIYNSRGKVVYQKQVGKWGVIKVGNK